MKTKLIVNSVIAVVTAAAAYAQDSIPWHADIPFDFIVNGRTIHAGPVTVRYSTTSGAVVVNAGGEGVLAISAPLGLAKKDNEARLVFHGYGNTYYLAEVWGPGQDGRKLTKSGRERELAANRVTQTKTIVLALR